MPKRNLDLLVSLVTLVVNLNYRSMPSTLN